MPVFDEPVDVMTPVGAATCKSIFSPKGELQYREKSGILPFVVKRGMNHAFAVQHLEPSHFVGRSSSRPASNHEPRRRIVVKPGRARGRSSACRLASCVAPCEIMGG